MIKSYIKISWRNLIKNKTFTLINIIGLAVGLACFILISLYIFDELSYDRSHEKADRIYRINSDIRLGDTELSMSTAGDPMGEYLQKDYPQIEAYVRFHKHGPPLMVKHNNEIIEEHRVTYVDSTLFDVFTFNFLAGDPRHALIKPNTVVLTQSAAERHFGSIDIIGKSLEVHQNDALKVYEVTAVVQDLPHNSHFNFDLFLPMENLNYPWGLFLSHNFQTYLLLTEGTDYREFEKNFTPFIEKYILPQINQVLKVNSLEELNNSGNKFEYSLMPLLDIHLHSDRFPELGVNSSVQYVYIFSAIGLFVLLLACINFTNLSTARSTSRAREVGIRKILGSEKKLLIGQFLAESILVVAISLILAIILAALFMDIFNDISGKSLQIIELVQPGFMLFLLFITIVVGVLSGLYPAFFLSSFKPLTVLKSKIDGGFRRSKFRSGLVVFQFLTSILLVTGTIIVFQQLNYIRDKKVGFDKDQVLIINNTRYLGNQAETFRNEIAGLRDVSSVSFASYLPVSNSSRTDNTFSTDAVMTEHNTFSSQIWNVDYDYLHTLNMNLVDGRHFSRDFGSDSTGIIINEAAAKIIGLENPIGAKLYMPHFEDNSVSSTFTIIGVVEDFHYESLRQQIGPLIMRLGNNQSAVAVRISAIQMEEVLNDIEQKWSSMAPMMPFTYHFLDDSFDAMYKTEQRVGKVALFFSLLAIIIACLGLFGLTTYMVEQRTKEIGIRKVLGASVSGIVALISKEFVKLVCLAIVIASPIAWWAMNKWLEDFAYRMDIQWWVFVSAGMVALVIALLTIGWQAVRAAIANPVDALRDE